MLATKQPMYRFALIRTTAELLGGFGSVVNGNAATFADREVVVSHDLKTAVLILVSYLRNSSECRT
jgi:hypothetical protein